MLGRHNPYNKKKGEGAPQGVALSPLFLFIN
jgi:hypothetical protein